MGKMAMKLDANTFAFFTRNPRGGKAKAIDEADVQRFLELAKEQGVQKLVAHSPYTLNPCSADKGLREFARKQGAEKGIALITEMLNAVLTPEQTTTVLLETMSGKGSEVGRNFQELRMILDGVHVQEKMGVCLDTCHVWDAGYDIVHDLDGVLAEFDEIIGLERLCAIHLNDSLNGLGSHKDRHARIGEGQIGLEALVRVINHPSLRHLPFILETPNDEEGYAKEIALLRANYRE